MIGRLQGQLIHQEPPFLLLDVNGVGYEVEAPLSVFFELPHVGEQVTLIIHHLVREDASILYGFNKMSQRELFRSLLKVSGIGAKSALAILSTMSGAEFIQNIHNQNVDAMVKIPGIGKKTAQRLIIEMKDKVSPVGHAEVSLPGQQAQPSKMSAQFEAESALQALGFKPQEASAMVKQVASEGMPVEEIIRLCLQNRG
ncbi:Holliday junction branch migration protein RuvA [Marinicella sp. W31]|uniref:Holliday junction branch migration protein RuvA n=1 Tax=Marinicella sp. W31 TaxID=3023713 RepID=UPI003756B285